MPLEIKATIGGRSIKRIVDQALEDVHRTLPKALGAHAVRDIEGGQLLAGRHRGLEARLWV